MRVIKLHSVHFIYSKRMLAKYMRCMRNNNLEIRISGSSCPPPLISIEKDVKSHFGSFVSKPSGNILYVMFDKYFVT